MTRPSRRAACAAIFALSCAFAHAGADPALTVELVADGFDSPLYVVAPPGDTERLMVLEQFTGRVELIKNGQAQQTPFLDLGSIISTDAGERGLLGLAFHPEYQTNGRFFVNYTNTSGNTVVAEYGVSANPDIANPAAVQQIIGYFQPFGNHNAGWMGFGPDGYLYISSGDGGSANDPGERAQDITNQLLGKILRLDVESDAFPGDSARNYAIPASNPFVGVTGDDEIWAYGLRNAWRCSFDRETGDFYVADVGQDEFEEINFQLAASDGGENYGWRCREGLMCTGLSNCTCPSPVYTDPVYAYAHVGSFCSGSVTGGYVYRGCAIPELRGTYFFADFCQNFIRSLRVEGGAAVDVTPRPELMPSGSFVGEITSFGEDAYGELLIVSRGGRIHRVVRDGAPLNDCNGNGAEDACDIAMGLSEDANMDGVPDSCQCPGDLDGDGAVGSTDLALLLGSWGTADVAADLDDSGDVGSSDLALLLGSWGPC